MAHIRKKLHTLFNEDEMRLLTESIPTSDVPVWQHWSEFVRRKEKAEMCDKTIDSTYHTLRYFALHWGLASMEAWMDNDRVFDVFHALRDTNGWSGSTFNTYRKNANTYFRYLVKQGHIAKNPIAALEKVKDKKRNYHVPSDEDIKKLWDHLILRKCQSEMVRARNKLFFTVIAITWMRPSEALGMKLSSFSRDRSSLCVDGAKLGGKPRAYPVDDSMRRMLSDYCKEVTALSRDRELDRYLFLSGKTGRAWTYSWVKKLVDGANEELGFDSRITCYAFRRLCATNLFSRWTPIERISQYLGHSRPSTTMRYVQGLPQVNEVAYGVMAESMAWILI